MSTRFRRELQRRITHENAYLDSYLHALSIFLVNEFSLLLRELSCSLRELGSQS